MANLQELQQLPRRQYKQIDEELRRVGGREREGKESPRIAHQERPPAVAGIGQPHGDGRRGSAGEEEATTKPQRREEEEETRLKRAGRAAGVELESEARVFKACGGPVGPAWCGVLR